MRRSTLAVLATVSLATLVSVATASQAVQPPAVNLGVLKPTEDWKVGTVQAGDTSFCAMVTKFDSGVGLAFARTPDGYGTVAMNLNQSTFTTGDNYDVKLIAEGAKARTLKARATSDRSIVVQIGQDKALYDALKGNGDLEISMPAADVKFSLNSFSRSFKSLVSCSEGLGGKGNGPKVASAKVQDVEQDSLAPIDREVQKLSEGPVPSKAVADGETSLDAQLDAAALGAPGADNAKVIAAATAPSTDVAQPKPERKLLASAHSDTPSVPPSDSGSMAKQWDSQQQTAAVAKSAADKDKAALQQAVADREAKIASLDADKNAAASREVAEFDRKQKLLDDQTAALHHQNDKTAAADKNASDADSKQAAVSEDDEAPAVEQKPAATAKAAKAGLVAKTAALARIDAQRQQQRDELDSKLASNQSEYQNKIAALEAERDTLKAHLAETSEKSGKLEKQEADEGSQLASARAEISSLKADAAQKLSSLEKTLSDRTAALDVLQKQGDGRTSALVKEHRALTDQLEEKNAQVAELEKKLADTKSVETAKADTPAGRKSLVIVNDDAAAAGNKVAASGELEKAQAEVAELRMKNAALSEQAALASSTIVSAADRKALESQQADMAKAQAEVADLRARNNELAAQVAEAHNAPAPGTDKAALRRARDELAELREKNEALSLQAAKAQTASTGAPAAKTALDSQRADLDKAQAELADLKSKNADLSGKLASAQTEAQHQLAQTEAQEHAKLQEAQSEIASLRAARAENEQKLAAAKTEPAMEAPAKTPASAMHVFVPQAPVRSLAETEPSTGNAVSSQGADAASAAASTATVAAVAAAGPAPAAKSSYDENRAAAFLDKIMAYHRPAGAPSHASASLASSQPVFGHASTAAPLQPVASYHPVAASADTSGMMSAMPGDAASAPAVAAALAPAPVAAPALAPASTKVSFDAPKAVASGNGVQIEKLLSTSGVDASFKSDTAANGSVRQWTAGNLNGMYEQMPAGNFETLAQSYIGRYRQDCPGKLDVTMTHPQTTAAGTLERANVSCGIPSNSYSTSFVFLQEGGKFGAILHTGYPEDAAKVRAIGDNIASTLGAGGVSETPVATKAEAVVPSVSHHFTIPAVTSQQ